MANAVSTRYSGHRNAVRSLSFSPDGQRILSGSFDGSARIWDALTGEVVDVFVDGGRDIPCVAWSPNGETLAIVFHPRPPKPEYSRENYRRIQERFFRRHKPAYEPNDDSNDLSEQCHADEIRIYSANDGQPKHLINEHVRKIEFSPDGRLLAAISWNKLMLIDVDSAEVIRRIECDEEVDSFEDIVFSDDGSQLACLRDDTDAEVFSTASLQTIGQHSVCPDDDLNKRHEQVIAFWRKTLSGFRRLRFSEGCENSFARSLDGHVWASSGTGYELQISRGDGEPLTINRQRHLITAASFSQCGRKIAIGDTQGAITFLTLPTPPPRQYRSVQCLSDSRCLVAGTAHGVFEFLDINSATCLHTIELNGSDGFFIDQATHANVMALGCRTGVVGFFDSSERRHLSTLQTCHSRFVGGTLSADGTKFWGVFTTEYRRRVLIAELLEFCVRTGEILSANSLPKEQRCFSVCASPSKQQIALVMSKEVQVFDLHRPKREKSIPCDSGIRGIFTDEQTLLVANEGYGMQLIDIDSGGLIREFLATEDGPSSFAVHDNLLARATHYFEHTEIFELSTGHMVGYCSGHLNNVSSVAFLPNGHTLATASNDGTLRLWDVESCEELRRFGDELTRQSGDEHQFTNPDYSRAS